jgi:hypothetical protein
MMNRQPPAPMHGAAPQPVGRLPNPSRRAPQPLGRFPTHRWLGKRCDGLGSSAESRRWLGMLGLGGQRLGSWPRRRRRGRGSEAAPVGGTHGAPLRTGDEPLRVEGGGDEAPAEAGEALEVLGDRQPRVQPWREQRSAGHREPRPRASIKVLLIQGRVAPPRAASIKVQVIAGISGGYDLHFDGCAS